MTDTELLQALYNDMQTVKHKVTSMEDKVTSLDGRVASLDEKVASLDEKVASLEHEILKINVTLENETNRNIKIVAEGHLDLSRKLDEALNVENEKEMLLVRVNILESDVRRLKEKVATIA